MIDARVKEIYDMDSDDVTVDDVIYLLNLLQNDKQLIAYFKNRDMPAPKLLPAPGDVEPEDFKSFFDEDVDYRFNIQDLYPDYDGETLDTIQGIIQNSAFAYVVAQPVGTETDDYYIRGETLEKFREAGMSVSVEFDYEDAPDEHFPLLTVETKDLIFTI